MDKLLTIEQVAERLQVHYQTAYRKIRSGEINAVKVGRVWRVSEESLMEFLNSQKEDETDVNEVMSFLIRVEKIEDDKVLLSTEKDQKFVCPLKVLPDSIEEEKVFRLSISEESAEKWEKDNPPVRKNMSKIGQIIMRDERRE